MFFGRVQSVAAASVSVWIDVVVIFVYARTEELNSNRQLDEELVSIIFLNYKNIKRAHPCTQKSHSIL